MKTHAPHSRRPGRVPSRRPDQVFPYLRFFDDRGLRVQEPYSLFADEVHRHLCRVAMRRLNDHSRAGLALPTCDELVEFLLVYAEPQLKRRLGGRLGWRRDPSSGEVAPSRGYYRETLDRAGWNAAKFCLEAFDPEYLVRRARAGGKASKRPPLFRPEQLIGLEHLSRAEQASALGCSVHTIKKLRAAQRTTGAAEATATSRGVGEGSGRPLQTAEDRPMRRPPEA